MPGQLGRRVLDQREVRLAVGVQRRRQADDVGVAVLRRGVVGRGADEALVDHGLERLAGDVLDVAAAGVDLVAARGHGLDADDLDAGLGEHHGQRQADVAQADDCDLHGELL